jgi:hypothetical protein
MTDITVLSIVEKLEAAGARLLTTGDKSSFQGTVSWAKGVAKKLDAGEDPVAVPEPEPEPEPEEEPAEEETRSLFGRVRGSVEEEEAEEED